MRAAAVQLSSNDDVDRNLEVADRLVRAAARDGAELVVLPEKWPALGPPEVVAAGAQRAGDVVAWATATARELRVDLVAGSIAMEHEDGRLRNTALHVGPEGETKATYVKRHLFDVEVAGRTYRESDAEDAGDATVVTTTGDGTKLGLAICYDLRFADLFEELQQQGATVFAVPSAFTEATTRDHWDVLTRARAIEQQAFVIAANQVGEHPGGMRSGGRSMIIDPWGVVLARAPDTETHVIADLDRDHQQRIRAQLPALQHRRQRQLA
jgi:deaminated glutathione amidase